MFPTEREELSLNLSESWLAWKGWVNSPSPNKFYIKVTMFNLLFQSMQAEIDARSQDVIRKESQVMIALRERDSSVQKLKDQEGIYWNNIIKYKQDIH